MRSIGSLAVLLTGLLSTVHAAELLKDSKTVELERGAAVDPTSTLSGYPLYAGDGGWKFLRFSAADSSASGEAQSVRLIELALEQIEPDNNWFANMFIRINASSAGANQYWTGSPCKGDFTYVVDKSVRRDDNCQTLKAFSYKSGTNDKVYLSLKFTHSATGGRLLVMELRLNPEMLGFRQTNTNSWSAESVARSPAKQRFIDRLKQFGAKLQAANQDAIGFDKPKEAYAGIPSYRTLLDVPEDLSDGTFTQQFIGAVEHVKNSPDFKAIAYSKWGGNRVSWTYYDAEESESVAGTKALEGCNKNKRAEAPACVLYDLKVGQKMKTPEARNSTNKVSAAPAVKSSKPVETRLNELKGLLDKGLITQEEFTKRREDILKDI